MTSKRMLFWKVAQVWWLSSLLFGTVIYNGRRNSCCWALVPSPPLPPPVWRRRGSGSASSLSSSCRPAAVAAAASTATPTPITTFLPQLDNRDKSSSSSSSRTVLFHSVAHIVPEEEEIIATATNHPISQRASSNSNSSDVEFQRHMDHLLEQRVAAREKGNYEEADALLGEMHTLLKNEEIRLVVEDIPRAKGGGSQWTIALNEAHFSLTTTTTTMDTDATASQPQRSVLHLAHMAVGAAASEYQHSQRNHYYLEELSQQAKEQLQGWCIVDAQLRQLIKDKRVVSLHAFFQSMYHDRHDENSDDGNINDENATAATTTPSLFSHWVMVEMHLRGRKAADAAFWFALAGVADETLFDLLVQVCTKELQRFGSRDSCRAKDILAIMERLAASGIRQNANIEQVARRALESKLDHQNSDKEEQVARRALESKLDQISDKEEVGQFDFDKGSPDLLNLHSDMCAFRIWKFSTRQRKQRVFLETAANHWQVHSSLGTSSSDDVVGDVDNKDASSSAAQSSMGYDWSQMFQDPSRPLIIDIGCGMGVSLLGLASLETNNSDDETEWSKCNFLGADLSSLAIGYANGITTRWRLQDRLQFVRDSAEHVLEAVRTSYPGSVHTILLQFPTPYRLPASLDDEEEETGNEEALNRGGNSQLPSSATDGFMVTKGLMQQAATLMQSTKLGQESKLILQSNCEDVALYMKDLAAQQGLDAADARPEESCNDWDTSHAVAKETKPTQRTMNWIAMGGQRAMGLSWFSDPILPPRGRTETEIACLMNGTPVHRCIVVTSGSESSGANVASS